MPGTVRSLIERAATTWMKGDAKAFAALFTPDGEFIVPGQRWVGREAIEKVALEFARGHSHVKISIQRLIADQQQAAVEWRWEEIETSTGKKTQADDAIVVDFANGYIKRWREYIDSETPKVS
ncbi:MAG: SgcJ/EcaC family oxidoreductase [Stenomitos rutilans HA7619-LM2]|nr:SgcJ/EcaC family oxidoreductase [Stenomitos rutilans HA7619-LM2]